MPRGGRSGHHLPVPSGDPTRALFRSPDITLSGELLFAGDRRQARERRLSLTDCVTIEAMRRRGLREFIGEDEHLEREGFRAL